MLRKGITITGLVFFIGCAPIDRAEKEPWKPRYLVQAGINHGGIAENTDFALMNNTEVDAFSGATTVGVHAGGHIQLPVRRNSLETGAGLMYNRQKFTYNDEFRQFNGTRYINLYQLMVPVIYNIGIYRKFQPEGLIQFRLGYVMQFNFPSVSGETGIVPAYNIIQYSGGPTFGISSTPFTLKNGNKVGLYLDLYRGTQTYEDVYNQTTFEGPGTSYFRGGIIYHFGNKK